MITSPPFRPGLRSRRYAVRAALGTLLALGVSSVLQSAPPQEEHKRKIPVIDKLSSGGNHQAFSGTVQSLDLGQHVLELNARESETMEIFTVKKGVLVHTADGKKVKLQALAPGTNIMVYYDQKGDHRTVKQILVLEDSGEPKKKSAPSS